MTLSKLIKELGIAAVPHGFRSSFLTGRRSGQTHTREVVEAALAHTVRNPTEAAYARSDLFERRRRLMDDWAAYLGGSQARTGHVPAIPDGIRLTSPIPIMSRAHVTTYQNQAGVGQVQVWPLRVTD